MNHAINPSFTNPNRTNPNYTNPNYTVFVVDLSLDAAVGMSS